METKKILLAEDDTNLGKILQSYLKAKGFEVDLFINGEEAFFAYHKKKYDMLILDVMMPVMDGFTTAQNIRKTDSETPILFLTAKSLEEDKLKGFELGGDDYITKPFNMELLLARMEAIFRRVHSSKEKVKDQSEYKIGIYKFDYIHQELSGPTETQKLTSREADLLKLLCDHENEVLDRRIALNKIWKDDSYFNARSMDVYITKLRKYFKEDKTIQIINIHGVGFKLLTE
jgi:DNA-binding response OmpR family regulator